MKARLYDTSVSWNDEVSAHRDALHTGIPARRERLVAIRDTAQFFMLGGMCFVPFLAVVAWAAGFVVAAMIVGLGVLAGYIAWLVAVYGERIARPRSTRLSSDSEYIAPAPSTRLIYQERSSVIPPGRHGARGNESDHSTRRSA